MSAGSESGGALREYYAPLPAGTLLWHVYPSFYDARAFNPNSRNRFALPALPTRAMFYAADSAECALWEAVLRNLVVEDHQPQHVDPALLENRSIAQLRSREDLPILDLRSPHFRHLSSDSARHAEWQRLAVVPERDYGQTHDAARELIGVAPKAAGLCWHSRQFGARTAFVFYSPPLESDQFEVLEATALNRRWDLIDRALGAVGVERVGVLSLTRETLEELPPDEPFED